MYISPYDWNWIIERQHTIFFTRKAVEQMDDNKLNKRTWVDSDGVVYFKLDKGHKVRMRVVDGQIRVNADEGLSIRPVAANCVTIASEKF